MKTYTFENFESMNDYITSWNNDNILIHFFQTFDNNFEV